jgi:sec-independent protein translocase protein TatA
MPLRNLGAAELIIILVLAVLIFGPGRIGQIGTELGRGIRGFKEGVADEATESAKEQAD